VKKAARRLSKLFQRDISAQVPPIDAVDAVKARQKAIEQVFKILPTPDGAEHEALSRDIRRLRPAKTEWDKDKEKKGSGARDVVIWLTVLEAARTDGGEVLFLSDDGDFGSAKGWHPELDEEMLDAHPRLLHGGIGELIDELATSAPEPGNTMALLSDPVVTGAVASSYAGTDVFFPLIS
jgi:hypothetical protein